MMEISELGVSLTQTFTNPNVGDLQLDDSGDLVWLSELAPSVAQRLTVRLNFFRGEWILDTALGTPYYQNVLGIKAPDNATVRTVFLQVIKGTEGVVDVDRFGYAVSRDRRLSLEFTARLADRSTFKSRDYPRFTVLL